MTDSLPKIRALRLNATSYRELCRQILKRDAWRCQSCGSMQNLHVHHQQFRSHSGPDEELNLITLCADCHTEVHRKESVVAEASKSKD